MWDAETRRAWNRAYYQKNIEKRRALARASYKRHREKRLAYVHAYNQKNKATIAARDRVYKTAHPEKRRAATQAWRLRNPAHVVLISAKQRAKRLGLPFSLIHTDIFMPEFCPVLGIRLQHSKTRSPCAASPSLDRKIPELGYVPGNVAVISWRANVIKHNATPEELRAVAAWASKETP